MYPGVGRLIQGRTGQRTTFAVLAVPAPVCHTLLPAEAVSLEPLSALHAALGARSVASLTAPLRASKHLYHFFDIGFFSLLLFWSCFVHLSI